VNVQGQVPAWNFIPQIVSGMPGLLPLGPKLLGPSTPLRLEKQISLVASQVPVVAEVIIVLNSRIQWLGFP
jgi:hypothetical protein